MTYLFLLASLNSQIAPLQALKSSLKQDICFDLLNKKAQVTLLPKKQTIYPATILQANYQASIYINRSFYPALIDPV